VWIFLTSSRPDLGQAFILLLELLGTASCAWASAALPSCRCSARYSDHYPSNRGKHCAPPAAETLRSAGWASLQGHLAAGALMRHGLMAVRRIVDASCATTPSWYA